MVNEIDGLDTGKGISRFGGNEGLYFKILRAYAVSIRALLTSIDVTGEGDLKDYEIIVHGIKGSSFNICADTIGNLAKNLENAAKINNRDYVVKYNPHFLEAAWKLIFELESFFQILDLENSKPIKDKPDTHALFMLLAACEKCDLDEADAAMEEISSYHYESDDGLAIWLQDNVEQMKFTEIIEKLSGILQ